MIKKLRVKLVLASMFSLLLVLVVIVGSINVLNFYRMVEEADTVLAILSYYNGELPKRAGLLDQEGEPAYTSPEVPYESRYFSVLLNADGAALDIDTGQIAAVDPETAAQFAQDVLDSGKTAGFVQDYRYAVQRDGDGVRISFLDCGRRIDTCGMFLWTSLCISALGLFAVFLLITLLSGRIVRPVSDSYEKQKRFITDAGHEIKTPLAIIDADAGLIEMESGENEWLTDIQAQVKRLAALTNDLVYLAQMEEARDSLTMVDFPLSELAEELVRSFQALARKQGKTFQSSVQPRLTLHGDEKSIRQLISILLDNALKYSDEAGEIRLTLEKQGRALRLSVCNTTSGIRREELDHLFERFYRTDKSRNSQTGGYGIGLSIASAVTAAHKGKISAHTPDGRSLQITVTLPAS